MFFYFLFCFFFRYKGKSRPDAVMAEICWRAKNLFQDAKFQKKPIEKDEQHENDAAFGDYKDSDNDDDDVE